MTQTAVPHDQQGDMVACSKRQSHLKSDVHGCALISVPWDSGTIQIGFASMGLAACVPGPICNIDNTRLAMVTRQPDLYSPSAVIRNQKGVSNLQREKYRLSGSISIGIATRFEHMALSKHVSLKRSIIACIQRILIISS
jgi:hypothetical protein